MDVLILMRHGKAAPPDEAPDDKSRGLTERGRRQAAEAGEAIARTGLVPDRILVSGATRTRQTYASLQPSFAAAPTFLDTLYMATAAEIWDEAIESGGAVVLVVGHNPGMHELAAGLADQTGDLSGQSQSLRERFPTSAVAAFSVSGAKRRAANPRLLLTWVPSS